MAAVRQVTAPHPQWGVVPFAVELCEWRTPCFLRQCYATSATEACSRSGRWPSRRATAAIDDAHNAIGQLKGSFKLSADLTDVRLRTSHLSSDVDLAEVRPSAIGKLDGPALVGASQALTMRTVCAEGKPERILAGAVMDTRVDLGNDLPCDRRAPGGNRRREHQRRRRGRQRRAGLSAGGQRVGVLADDGVIYIYSGPHLGAGMGDETVERKNLPDGNTGLGIRRQPRRRTRNRRG